MSSSNFENSNTLNNEQLVAMQQRLVQLEQFISQQQFTAQPSAEQPIVDSDEPMTGLMDPTLPVHSLETRPSYNWTPPPLLSQVLQLNAPLFTEPLLTDEVRRQTIDKYPGIEGIQYQPPDTLPMTAKKMKPHQSKQDMSLKRPQYLISGIFRPMDVLGLEISKDVNNENVQRYLYMLRDCRNLLLNVSSQLTDMRNNLAIQSINPSFSSSTSTNNYTMSPTDFQALLVQQTAAAQAVQKAGNFRNGRRSNNHSNNNQAHSNSNTQFFRSGPSSSQGGYNNNQAANNNNNRFGNNKSNNAPQSNRTNNNNNNNTPYRNNQQ